MIKVCIIVGTVVSTLLSVPLFFIKLGGPKPQTIEQCRDTVIETPAKCPVDTRAAAVWHVEGGDNYMLCVCAGSNAVVKW